MIRSLSTFSLAAVLAAPALAQAGMPVASEMKAYDSLLGKWKGKGLLTDGGARRGLQISVELSKVLDGHFIERKMVLQFEGAPGPIEVLTYMGWDMVTESHLQFSVSNQPSEEPIDLEDVRWVDGQSYIDMEVTNTMAGPAQMRWQTTWTKDSIVMQVDRLAAGKELEKLMTLKLERVDALDVGITNKSFFGEGNVGAPMLVNTAREKLKTNGQSPGVWDVEGWAVNEAMPTFKIDAKGTETITPILDGLVHRSDLSIELGGMGSYHGIHFVVWNAKTKMLNRLMISNYGEIEQTALTNNETGQVGVTVGARAERQLPKWTVWTKADASAEGTLDFYTVTRAGKPLHLSAMTVKKRED